MNIVPIHCVIICYNMTLLLLLLFIPVGLEYVKKYHQFVILLFIKIHSKLSQICYHMVTLRMK